MKIQNTLVLNIPDRSQRYFAHVTTVTLSWRVQNIVVIGRVYFTLECFEFSSNFEFDRNMLSGTGARSGFTSLMTFPAQVKFDEKFIWLQFGFWKSNYSEFMHIQRQGSVGVMYLWLFESPSNFVSILICDVKPLMKWALTHIDTI